MIGWMVSKARRKRNNWVPAFVGGAIFPTRQYFAIFFWGYVAAVLAMSLYGFVTSFARASEFKDAIDNFIDVVWQQQPAFAVLGGLQAVFLCLAVDFSNRESGVKRAAIWLPLVQAILFMIISALCHEAFKEFSGGFVPNLFQILQTTLIGAVASLLALWSFQRLRRAEEADNGVPT